MGDLNLSETTLEEGSHVSLAALVVQNPPSGGFGGPGRAALCTLRFTYFDPSRSPSKDLNSDERDASHSTLFLLCTQACNSQ